MRPVDIAVARGANQCVDLLKLHYWNLCGLAIREPSRLYKAATVQVRSSRGRCDSRSRSSSCPGTENDTETLLTNEIMHGWKGGSNGHARGILNKLYRRRTSAKLSTKTESHYRSFSAPIRAVVVHATLPRMQRPQASSKESRIRRQISPILHGRCPDHRSPLSAVAIERLSEMTTEEEQESADSAVQEASSVQGLGVGVDSGKEGEGRKEQIEQPARSDNPKRRARRISCRGKTASGKLEW